MDEQFELNGISFVWSQTKAQENLRKHGVAFKQAAEAFFDPFLRVVDASSDDEARDAIIGMDERWNLLFVVHIAFEDESVRLIPLGKRHETKGAMYEN
jgi:uncharacterized DUF497 family protein